MFNEAFEPKEVQELLMKLRVNPKKKDKQYEEGKEWLKYLHTTEGKNGDYKGKELKYFVLELDGVAKSGSETRSGKRMIAATIGNHVRTVFEKFDKKLFDLIKDIITDGGIDNATREMDVCIEGNIYDEQCGFEYNVKIGNRTVKRNSVKVICLLDENIKAATMIKAAIDEAAKTKISTGGDKAAEEFAANNQHSEAPSTSDDDDDE